MDHARPKARDWLNRHFVWAFNQGYGVVLNRIVDEPKNKFAQARDLLACCDNPHCPGHDDDAGEA